ncbi:hypothetical protein C8R45DRAFT_947416 [Mycena sanguinolenta]|nr:hypothetical protein C8R45DRAFT_947416 [Mycena sanguinolenta]
MATRLLSNKARHKNQVGYGSGVREGASNRARFTERRKITCGYEKSEVCEGRLSPRHNNLKKLKNTACRLGHVERDSECSDHVTDTVLCSPYRITTGLGTILVGDCSSGSARPSIKQSFHGFATERLQFSAEFRERFFSTRSCANFEDTKCTRGEHRDIAPLPRTADLAADSTAITTGFIISPFSATIRHGNHRSSHSSNWQHRLLRRYGIHLGTLHPTGSISSRDIRVERSATGWREMHVVRFVDEDTVEFPWLLRCTSPAQMDGLVALARQSPLNS